MPGANHQLRAVSYGGGVQSTALLVLAAQRVIDFPVFLMANVGDDSEDPDTVAYLHRHAKPYAERHGIELQVIDRRRRDGSQETLYGRLTRPGSRSLPIPVRMSNGAPGTRSCTTDFKIVAIGRRLKAHGASPAHPAVVGIGISLDEIHRLHKRRAMPHEQPVYPLLDREPPLRRNDCETIIRGAGLPVPPKSACWFCPMHRAATWADKRRDRPDLFQRSCQLEELLNARRAQLGKDPVWLTRLAVSSRTRVIDRPLRTLPASQDLLPGLEHPEPEHCDNGSCFT